MRYIFLLLSTTLLSCYIPQKSYSYEFQLAGIDTIELDAVRPVKRTYKCFQFDSHRDYKRSGINLGIFDTLRVKDTMWIILDVRG